MKTNQLKIGDVVIIPARGHIKYLYAGIHTDGSQLFMTLSNQSISRTIYEYRRAVYNNIVKIPEYLDSFHYYSFFYKSPRTFHYCSYQYSITPGPKRRKTKQTIST